MLSFYVFIFLPYFTIFRKFLFCTTLSFNVHKGTCHWRRSPHSLPHYSVLRSLHLYLLVPPEIHEISPTSQNKMPTIFRSLFKISSLFLLWKTCKIKKDTIPPSILFILTSHCFGSHKVLGSTLHYSDTWL